MQLKLNVSILSIVVFAFLIPFMAFAATYGATTSGSSSVSSSGSYSSYSSGGSSAVYTPTYSGGSSVYTPTYSGGSAVYTPTSSGGSAVYTPTYSGGSAVYTPTYSGGSAVYTSSSDWLSCDFASCGGSYTYSGGGGGGSYTYTSCSNQCSPSGKRVCSGSGYKVCGNYDSDKCLEWSAVKSCGSGQICSNGQCIESCTNECSVSGRRECSGNGWRQCGNYDSDSCLEWGSVHNCVPGETCVNGSCVKTCTDECSVSGQRVCSGNGWKQCGNYDNDSCKEWGPITNCAFNETCTNGSCHSTCQDQCTFGQHQCSGSSVRICGKYDNSGCTAWGSYQNCDSRCYSCGDDRCECGETKSSCPQDCGQDCGTLNVNAGSDKTADAGETIRLNGSVSGDYDYLDWNCTGGSLSDDDVLRPNWKAPNTDRTYTCTLTARNECGSDSDSMKITVEKEVEDFDVNLRVSPQSGCAPLNNVDLIAEITNYDNNSNDDFTYYFDCDNDGDWEKTVSVDDTDYTAKDLCDYRDDGSYTAKVKVARGGKTATDTATVDADNCSQDQVGDFEITKTARNLTAGGDWQGTITAKPLDMISYRIVVRAVSENDANIYLTDIIPNGITNIRDLQIDGGYQGGNNLANLDLGHFNANQTKTITYTATVANESAFGLGQNTLNNTATINVDGKSASSNAAVVVNRALIFGATTISTGLGTDVLAGLGIALVAAVVALLWTIRGNLGQAPRKLKRA